MTQRESYTVEVAGLVRHFPLFEVAPGVRIAVFNMLGDTYVVKASAAALAERLRDVRAEVLLTAEAKSIPLIYEMSALMGLPYVVLRKAYKSYMGQAISCLLYTSGFRAHGRAAWQPRDRVSALLPAGPGVWLDQRSRSANLGRQGGRCRARPAG